MAKTTHWEGTEQAAAQVSTYTVGGTIADGDEFKLTIGGIDLAVYAASTGEGLTIEVVRDGLITAWGINGAVHPFGNIMAIAAVSTDQLTLTASIGGVPFTCVPSEDGAASTFTETATTIPLGPNILGHAANWSNGLPADDDFVYITNSGTHIAYDLEALQGITVAELHIKKSFFGRIGLRRTEFAISANGVSTNSTIMEYRPAYLKMGADKVFIGAGNGSGSDRIKYWNNEATPTGDTFVKGTGVKSADSALSAIRLRGETVDLHVESAIAGVGLAEENPAFGTSTEEVFTCAKVYVDDLSSLTSVVCGKNAGFQYWIQFGGTNKIRVGNTAGTIHIVTSVVGWGGSIEFIPGNYYVATVELRGATIVDNHHIVVNQHVVTVTVGNAEIGDIFEVFIELPAYAEDHLLESIGEVSAQYGLSLGKFIATAADDDATATGLKNAIQDTIDNGPFSLFSVSVLGDKVTLQPDNENTYPHYEINTRAVNGGATDNQTLIKLTPEAFIRYSIGRIEAYSGVYDATQSSDLQYIQVVNLHGPAEIKWNETTKIDSFTGMRKVVGL